MSVQAISWAYECRGITPGQKFVLVTLCNRADEDWSCYPSTQNIAKETGFKDRAVRNHLNALEEAGIIRRTRARNSDGTLGRYRYFIQRQYVPAAKNAAGEKGEEKQEQAKNAAGSNHRQKTTITTGRICRSTNRQYNRQNSMSDEKSDFVTSFDGLWGVWSQAGRTRSKSKKIVLKQFEKVCKTHSPDEIIGAAKRFVSENVSDRGDFCPALERWLRDGRYEHYLATGGNVTQLQSANWTARAAAFRATGVWQENWGPKPNEDGCQCPPELLKLGAQL